MIIGTFPHVYSNETKNDTSHVNSQRVYKLFYVYLFDRRLPGLCRTWKKILVNATKNNYKNFDG